MTSVHLINVPAPKSSSFGSGSGDKINVKRAPSAKKKKASAKKKEHYSSSSSGNNGASAPPKVHASSARTIYGAPTDMSATLQTLLKPELQVDQKRSRYEKTLIHGEEHINVFLAEVMKFANENDVNLTSNTLTREYNSFTPKDNPTAMRDQVSYSFMLQKRNLAVRLTVRDVHDFKLPDGPSEAIAGSDRNIEVEWSCFPIFSTLMGEKRKLKFAAPQLQEQWESALFNRKRRAMYVRALARQVCATNLISWLAFVVPYANKKHDGVAQDMAVLRFDPAKVTKEKICADPDPSSSEKFQHPATFDDTITEV